ncbi:MAG: bifunctional 4-hydroxy-2-oxoglutarate aldolase/2-dehydro-3-deoxy-phosphogluconate aldolase [Candidatus Acidiferrales bacterium]
MNREQVLKRISEVGIVPVVRAASARHAEMATEAVREGGIPIVEITMTVPGAVEVIAKLALSMGNDVLIGAGTVLDAATARLCIDAGAEFIVSPGLDVATVEYVRREEKVMMAGALTPTEVITAWKAGSDFVKIFPCSATGGAKYIQALKGPLPQIPMIPTGGVNLNTAADFIRAGVAALGVGSELVSAAALKSGDKAPITEAAKALVAIVKETRAALEAN